MTIHVIGKSYLLRIFYDKMLGLKKNLIIYISFLVLLLKKVYMCTMVHIDNLQFLRGLSEFFVGLSFWVMCKLSCDDFFYGCLRLEKRTFNRLESLNDFFWI